MTECSLALSVCESPIESEVVRAMFDVWTLAGYSRWGCGIFKGNPLTMEFLDEDELSIKIALQVDLISIPRRRVDMVVMEDFSPPILVEFDGLRWHSSREQMMRDREKDRQALMLGYPTIRFTGPEIVSSPKSVAMQIREVAYALDFRAFLDTKERIVAKS